MLQTSLTETDKFMFFLLLFFYQVQKGK